ncbi:ABC transporter permease subunit [Clostridium sp. SYSU_GA19001]|uniref:ABC transporter permease n=1 Tax=Clostridium caldaquaticum TaxID=2940653 RepID=UPI0020775B38|nr:ABC transporter permease subunit [Clostridium caldaquaticum]MCM8711700.1 ABC transporter permease subunit [Clostridium caldaquaticum]
MHTLKDTVPGTGEIKLKKRSLLKDIAIDIRKNTVIYLMAVPMLLYFIIFSYIPMTGIIMAFKRYSPALGIFNSPWIGFKNFYDFFNSYYFFRLLRNTFLLSFYDLLFNFPIPIVFALLLNEIKGKFFKRTIQTISYMPYFISMVVICGIISEFTNSNGVITQLLSIFGFEKKNLLGQASMFRSIYVGSNMWQGMGYSSIIYLAALSGIDQELYEAAEIDGAGRWKQTWHITLPGIMPTIVILLILRMGSMFSVGFEKVLLLYSPATYQTADVISTFTYRKGLLDMNYSFSTAVGIFNSVINTSMLLFSNWLSRKYTDSSLF